MSTILATLTLATSATAATLDELHAREQHQRRTLHRDQGTLRFFTHHRRLLHGRTRTIAVRAIRFARAEIRWTRRELAETVAAMVVVSFPPHHGLWSCIHSHEAPDWSTNTGNGYYGGLQMHAGWGYGTSYHASDDSQMTQEWSAERGYRASGFSRSWLMGQWYHPECLGSA